MNQRGFSILELLLYIAILSMISVVLANSFTSLLQGRGVAEAQSEVNANMRFAFDRLLHDVKGAASVTVPASVGATSTTLELTQSSGAVTYDVLLGRMRRTALGSPEFITSDKVVVDSLVFMRIENYHTTLAATTTAIQAILTLSYNSSTTAYRYSESAEMTAALR